jgi:hypothetical protein
VHGRFTQVLGVLRADHDVSELAGAGRRPGGVDGEGQDVGDRVASAVVAVELPDPLRADQLDGQMPVLDRGRGQGGQDWRTQLVRGPDEVELDQPCCWRRGGRSAGAWFSAYLL